MKITKDNEGYHLSKLNEQQMEIIHFSLLSFIDDNPNHKEQIMDMVKEIEKVFEVPELLLSPEQAETVKKEYQHYLEHPEEYKLYNDVEELFKDLDEEE